MWTARGAAGVASALAVAAGVAGAAHGEVNQLFLGADARSETGYVSLVAFGMPGATVSMTERVGAESLAIATRVVGANRRATVERAARWRCDRLTRRFSAVVRGPDGGVATSDYEVRTPSCRNRLAMVVPGRVGLGRWVTVEVRDRWRIGGLRGRECVRAPRRRPRCRSVALKQGRVSALNRFRASVPGRWRVEMRTEAGLMRHAVQVGAQGTPKAAPRRARPTILAAGDSLMQGIDSFLEERLEGRARVRNAVRPATGLSKSDLLDWIPFARRQAARFRPDATVMVIGGGDGIAMRTPAGYYVACCGQPWVEEYARRVRLVMIAFARNGAGQVVWLGLPAPRLDERRGLFLAVNAALPIAARGMRTVRILSLSNIFTPGFRYRARMSYRGRNVRVREGDGIHLSLEGSRIAAPLVIRLLERRGVL